MKPAVLIGYGPNDIEIIGMVFKNMHDGIKWVRENLREQWQEIDETKGFYTHCNQASGESVRRVFKSYYNGCGECDQLVLREVEYATPLVSFDLD